MTLPTTEDSGASDQAPESWQQREQRALRAYNRDQAYRGNEQQKAERVRHQKQAICHRLQRRLSEYTYAGPIYYQHADGQRHYLDDAERDKAEAQLRKRMREFCSPD